MQKIQITNFGPIEYAEVEIKDMVIFIGEQASGKSTISKLIYFFKSLKKDLLRVITNLPEKADMEGLFRREIINKFYNFFGYSATMQKFKILFFFSEENTITLESFSEGVLVMINSDDSFHQASKKLRKLTKYLRELRQTKDEYEQIVIADSNERLYKDISSILNKLFEDEKSGSFIPAGRNITTTYSDQFKLDFFGNLVSENDSRKDFFSKNDTKITDNHSGDVQLMIEFLRKVEGLKDSFKNNDFDSLIEKELALKNITEDYAQTLHKAKSLIFEILKGKYQHDSNGEKIVFKGKNNRSVSLNNASSGQQESIRILQDLFLILLNKESAFRVIEEPEAHLYPLAQKKLIELIGMVLHYTDSQVLITTHSPYILSVVNNLIFAKSIQNLAKEQANGVEKEVGLNQDALIEPTDFQAYSIKNNEKWEFKSIFDEETNLISENYLDEISQIVAAEFDEMFELYKQLKPRKRQRKTN